MSPDKLERFRVAARRQASTGDSEFDKKQERHADSAALALRCGLSLRPLLPDMIGYAALKHRRKDSTKTA